MHTLEWHKTERPDTNVIGDGALALQAPIAVLPSGISRALGALVLVDTASHKTAGAAMLH